MVTMLNPNAIQKGSITQDMIDALVIDAKQDATDESLATQAKTIVGAINEVYKGGLKDASIGTSKIKDGAITEPKLDTDLVNVINSAVQPAELASALATTIASYVAKEDILDTTGSATDKVMSQHGVTEAINGVTNQVTELGQEVGKIDSEINGVYITQADVASSGKGFVSYGSGKIPTSNPNSDYYEIPNNGIKTISASIYANDSDYIAIAFYSSDTPTTESYMSGVQAQGTSSLETFSDIPVPNGCRLIIVSNRTVLGDVSFTAVVDGIADDIATLKQDVKALSLDMTTVKNELLGASIDQDDITPQIGFIYEGTKVIDANSNFRNYQIPNVGYEKVTASIYSNNVSVVAVAFYSTESILKSGFMPQSAISQGSGYEDYSLEVPEGCKLIVISNRSVVLATPTFSAVRESVEEKTDALSYLSNSLKGKNISVIGDSVSTIKNGNTPYWLVKSEDIGKEIHSYVSWPDVYNGTDRTSPTNKSIGGVTLTEEMIGTLQTFTPIADDIGKEIGKALNYNSSNVKTWAEVLCEKLGATLIANASYSGASICSGQSWAAYPHEANSYAWSPYTIGRCRKRNDDGTYTEPDVILIYRGINDFSHMQGNGYALLTDYDVMANGYPIDDTEGSGYNFRKGYYLTIKALRDAYPNAQIFICTLNVFKRVIYDRFPTRNGTNSLPQFNQAIREIANEMGCGLIEFDKDGITFENCYSGGFITDSATMPTHPNTKGHAVMARRAIHDIAYTL